MTTGAPAEGPTPEELRSVVAQAGTPDEAHAAIADRTSGAEALDPGTG
ncbi:hypothetical protein [Streptomyces sp. NPDC002537]